MNITNVFNISGRGKVICYSDENLLLKVNDKIQIVSKTGITAIARIKGIEMLNFTNPKENNKGKGALLITWDSTCIPDSDLPGSSISKAQIL